MALSQIFTLVPLWHPDLQGDVKPTVESTLPAPEFPSFSVRDLMEKGTPLLASSGKEFVKPTGILANSNEVKKARKEAMGRLGLDFLDTVGGADDIDLEKELASADNEADQDIDMSDGQRTPAVKSEVEDTKPTIHRPAPIKCEIAVAGPSKSPTPAAPTSPTNGEADPVDLSALSARERNRLKRKRKGGNSAFVAAQAAPQVSNAKYATAPSGQTK